MNRVQMIQREYVPEYNLQVLNNTLSARNEMHNKAVQATSELKTAIANLNLNESEEPFRQQLIADIENTLDNNSDLGDYAGSYDDMIKLSGELASNPALISKLKAQQEYQKFIQSIDARTDLPQHYKDYYKEQNKYYEGEYDNAGNWIRGTKWEPTKTAAQNIDKNIILNAAIKLVTPDKGTYSQTTWIDRNGNILSEYQPDAKLVRYNTATYSYEEVKAEDIRKAIKTVIDSNPLYADSLRQDWEIAKHDLLTGNKDALFNVDNGTGGPITFDEFVNGIFEEATNTYAYRYDTLTKNDFNKQYHKQLEAVGGINQATSPNSPYTNTGETAIFKDNSNILNFANIKKGNEELKKDFYDLKFLPSDFVKNTNLNNFDGFKQQIDSLLSSGKITEEQYNEAISTFKKKEFEYKEELHNNKKYNDAQKGTREYDANEFYADLLYGQLKPEQERSRFYNRLCKEWATIENGLFGNNGKGIFIQFGNSAVLNDFKQRLANSNLSDYVTFENNGVYIDRSNNNIIPEISNLYLESMQEGYKGKPLRKFWNRIAGNNDLNGDSILRVLNDGRVWNLNTNILDKALNGGAIDQLLLSRNIAPEMVASRNIFGKVLSSIPVISKIQSLGQYGFIYDSRDVFDPITKFIDRVNNYDNKQSTSELPIYNLNYNAGTPEGIIADARIREGDYEDLTERNALEKQAFDSKKALFNQIKNAGLYGMRIKAQDENGLMQYVLNADDIAKLQQALVRADPSNDQNSATIELDRTTGRYVAKVKFIEKTGGGNDTKYIPHILYLDDDNNNYISQLNNDPRMIGYRKVDNSRITNQDMFLGSFEGTDIYAQPVEGGTAFRITDDSLSENWNIIGPNSINHLQQVAYLNEIFNEYAFTDADLTNYALLYLQHMGHILNIDIEDKPTGVRILNSLKDNFGVNVPEEIINQIWEQ